MNDPNRDNKFSEYSFRYYEQLADYTNNHFFSSNILGLTFSGDKRDHPLNPTKGHFTSIATDGWNIFMSLSDLSGIARYARFQFAHFHFFSLAKNLVLATKFKAGHIMQLDDNSVIPFDRQFFAGGANSVRGWPARQLHYSYRNTQNASNTEDFNSDQFEFDSDIVGSSTLVEGSIEFRYHFNRPTNLSSQLADQISSIGFTGFIDFGNAFGWYAESPDRQTSLDPIDYFTKLAVSIGAGLRYDMPIGPLRADVAFPFFGPKVGTSNYMTYTFSEAFKSPVFYIGIGHAF
jgi:outer membrane protein assembly factor BamA